ncbi:ABC transporter permease [Horticoccus luteus]|uniref:ABC transporter permease n=1 Tax=Horticoccus luteus TaxID=2862869 RepID=A0A8F9TVB8_9BACT|nr:ABC transporter permease [Horticoccus luteus]QYM78785.1 ABC transporter permease [Horticoccus luteus]
MISIALKMLLSDRVKYAGLLFGLTFTAFLVTFAASYFGGMMTRSFALIADNPSADVWVMDPAVSAVDQTIDLPDHALLRVRSVTGVRSASQLSVAHADLRFADGRFQSVEVIGVDDATLAGLPPLADGAADALRIPNAAIADAGGTSGKLETPVSPRDRWPFRPHLNAPLRPLARGDEVIVNDQRVQIVGRGHGRPWFPPRPLLFTTLSTARRILPPERERLTFVLARVAPGASPAAVARRIASRTGLRARTATEFKADTVRWMLANSEDVGDAITMLTIAMLVGLGVTGVMMFMFTHQNLRAYAVLQAMGAQVSTLLGVVWLQAAICGAIGTGLGLGLCTLAGAVFTRLDFPFHMLWFAPVAGVVAVIFVSGAAAALSLRPLLTLRPAELLAG